MGNCMQMIDLEEPVTREELSITRKKINKHVVLEYDSSRVLIENDKGGLQWVLLKQETFDKIAKELGYSLKRSSKSG